MSTENHYVRTLSFLWDRPLNLVNDHVLVDNAGVIIASRDYHIFAADARYIPLVVMNGDVPKGIHWNGRLYYIRQMCEHIEAWRDQGVISQYQMDVLGYMINMLIYKKMAWDLNFHFPCVYMPNVSRTSLQSANIVTFLDQFPSDPYLISLDSETVTTSGMTSFLSGEIADDDMYDWEMLNEAINSALVIDLTE